jgi:hypothetical protein
VKRVYLSLEYNMISTKFLIHNNKNVIRTMKYIFIKN